MLQGYASGAGPSIAKARRGASAGAWVGNLPAVTKLTYACRWWTPKLCVT